MSYDSVKRDSALHFRTGGPGSSRELNILVGKNVDAGRLLAGVTFSDPGNWTSWPPHEHAEMLEEAYLYIDMPSPAFGVQYVYNNPQDPEIATFVREGDCVIIPQGTSERRRARRTHRVPLVHGGPPRGSRPAVWRRQCAA